MIGQARWPAKGHYTARTMATICKQKGWRSETELRNRQLLRCAHEAARSNLPYPGLGEGFAQRLLKRNADGRHGAAVLATRL